MVGEGLGSLGSAGDLNPGKVGTGPDKRDWEEIVHLLEIVDRASLKKMTKSQLVQVIMDLLAVTSQLQVEKEKQFKEAVETILKRNTKNEAKRKVQIEKDQTWIEERQKTSP
ncbi:hypothetical protein A3770_04p32270 [Chloropicon primus]|uniref:Uncharacterized protein n=1 Tax=Chloropicon primus TaxID=1764295 RepID=A0A5B8MJX8_9CHLO|nr:hypothetical protein A3770_04p32270 [Chloropicon primus]|eukprot:QDZ20709.1 hypothetical protein A3770_04p32270 [Chloropicon primus]